MPGKNARRPPDNDREYGVEEQLRELLPPLMQDARFRCVTPACVLLACIPKNGHARMRMRKPTRRLAEGGKKLSPVTVAVAVVSDLSTCVVISAINDTVV